MHGSSFKDRHFVAKELLNLNNTINIRLIRLYNYFISIFHYISCAKEAIFRFEIVSNIFW